MKKLLFAMLSVMLIACTKKEETPAPNSGTLSGTYKGSWKVSWIKTMPDVKDTLTVSWVNDSVNIKSKLFNAEVTYKPAYPVIPVVFNSPSAVTMDSAEFVTNGVFTAHGYLSTTEMVLSATTAGTFNSYDAAYNGQSISSMTLQGLFTK